MKEVRAFLELTSLCLLPAVVLFFALHRVPVPAAAPAAEALPSGTVAAPLSAPRMAAVTGEEAPSAAQKANIAVCADESVSVRILTPDGAQTMTLRDYLVGVVAAEMPASFEPEALKAQAVAARTDTVYRMLVSRPHADGDCCTDPGCCKAYAAPEELRERWGDSYEKWCGKIAAAVSETDGEVLTYGGEPIFAAFHAASEGATECSENVWLSALPYLRSVSTMETAADVPRFRETMTLTAAALRERLTARCGDVGLPEDPADWLTDPEWSDSGRLLRVKAGSVTLSGTSLRSVLGLRSAAVTWTWDGECFVFETVGYGHGVGMSQYGAEVMAASGADHRDILLHYYTGAALAALSDVFPA